MQITLNNQPLDRKLALEFKREQLYKELVIDINKYKKRNLELCYNYMQEVKQIDKELRGLKNA